MPSRPSPSAAPRLAVGDLTFTALRRANRERLPLFKNRRGEPAHSEPDGSDWLLSAWCNAVCGELGEAANLVKKVERGDLTLDDARADLARELADVATYLDLLAFRAGIDLGSAVIAKFNEVGERVGCDVRLRAHPDLRELLGDPEVIVALRRRAAWQRASGGNGAAERLDRYVALIAESER